MPYALMMVAMLVAGCGESKTSSKETGANEVLTANTSVDPAGAGAMDTVVARVEKGDGLVVEVLQEGTGRMVQPGDTVTLDCKITYVPTAAKEEKKGEGKDAKDGKSSAKKPGAKKSSDKKADAGKTEETKPAASGSSDDAKKDVEPKDDPAKKDAGADDKKEGEKQDAAKKAGESKDTEKKDTEKKDTEQKDAEKKDAETKDTDKTDAESKDIAKSDSAKQEGDKKDEAKGEAEKTDTAKPSGDKKDGDRKDGEKKDAEKQDPAKKEGESLDATKSGSDTAKPAEAKPAEPLAPVVVFNSKSLITPFQVQLSSSSKTKVVPGLALALEGLKVGTRARITVPAALAYGKEGSKSAGIPGDTPLEIEVLVKEARG